MRYKKWCRECRILELDESSPFQEDRISALQAYLNLKRPGATLKSSLWQGSHTPLQVRCADGHEFQMRPGHIRAGRWCRDCRLRPKDDSDDENHVDNDNDDVS